MITVVLLGAGAAGVWPLLRAGSASTTATTFVITQDEQHAAQPVTLSEPAKLRVGQHWVQDYTFGGVHSVSRNRVTGRCGADC